MRPHLGPCVDRRVLLRVDATPTRGWMRLQARGGATGRARRRRRSADAAATFDQVRALADAAAGVPAPGPVAARMRPDRKRPPRLTEPWFC